MVLQKSVQLAKALRFHKHDCSCTEHGTIHHASIPVVGDTRYMPKQKEQCPHAMRQYGGVHLRASVVTQTRVHVIKIIEDDANTLNQRDEHEDDGCDGLRLPGPLPLVAGSQAEDKQVEQTHN